MTEPVTTTTHDLTPLITELRGLIQSARHTVATTVNTLQVMTNFEIGRRIVEHEQKGAERAEYGKELLKELSVRLAEEFGRGFSEDNLARMRSFYTIWKDSAPDFPRHRRGKSPSDQFAIYQSPSVELAAAEISQTPSAKFSNPDKIALTAHGNTSSTCHPRSCCSRS
jgi:hypothetical protein